MAGDVVTTEQFIGTSKQTQSQIQQTKLSSEEEIRFRDWFTERAKNTNTNPDPDNPNHFYDARGYWKEKMEKGIKPTVTGHLDDTYKLPGHETFSVESKYYKPGMKAVKWEGGKPIPVSGKDTVTTEQFMGSQRTTAPEPPPFPFDPWANELFKDHSPEQKVEKNNGLTNVFYSASRPWLSAGYSGASSINRSMAHFTDTLDVMSRWFESQGLGKKEGFFEQMTKTYNENADWWKDRAEKVGVNFLSELAGEAFALPSNALIGITDFSLKVASGFSIPAITGFQTAKEHDQDPFIGGLLEAAKFKTLDSMFKLLAPFNKYIQSLVMGTTFGAQEAVEAPEGQRAKAFIKGAATGVGMAIMAPSGKWGIRDVYPEVGSSVPEIRKEIEAFEKGEVPLPGTLMDKPSPDRGNLPSKEFSGYTLEQVQDARLHFSENPFDKGTIREYLKKQFGEGKEPTTEPTENLRPAVTYQGRTIIGNEGETHPDTMKREGIAPDTESQRGFATPEGEFLSRDEAKDWMIDNQPDIYEKWTMAVGEDKTLHSEDYAKAAEMPVGPGAATAGQKWYHGTVEDFPEFDQGKIKSVTHGRGFYFTDDPEIASGYAEKGKATYQPKYERIEPGPNVRVSKLDVSNPLDYERAKTNPTEEERQSAIQILEDRVQSAGSQADNILVKDMFNKIEKGANPVNYLHGEDLDQFAKENGYDAILYKGGKTTGGKEHNVMVVFDESKIKPYFEKRVGPGAATAGAREVPPDIAQLGQALQSLPKESSLSERIDIATKATRIYEGIMAAPKNAIEKVKAISEATWDWYNRQPQWSTFDDMLGKYLGGREMRGMELENKFVKPINKTLSKDKQIAIECYAKAGGDKGTLQEWVDGSTDPVLKKGYQDALSLTPDEITVAENVRQYYASKLDEAIDAGVLDYGVENYVNQMWEKPDNETAQRLKAEINSGMLRINPSFAKKRIFESDFEGEQKGFKPKDKRIGFRIAAYEQAMGEAIDARAFVKSLFDGDAADGRPLVAVRGGGSTVPKGEAPETYLIRPRSTPEEAFDYKELVHPALRKWKWATKDAEGNPIFVQGDVIVHPEIYDKLNNVLSRSAIRESTLGKGALRGSMELKSTLLSLSSFHQVQIGIHGIFHWENVFNADPIDFNQPIQRKLVEHGLMVYNHNAIAEFSEGLSTSGLTNRIPVLGPYLQKYTGYMFQDLIPRLKMKLAVDMVERNTARYPNLNRDQILKLSSDQANAAFGELNYKQMGRNPTTQDIFRLGALAPDFLEARARFVGQALKPYGREQAIALIRGATMMYLGAKLIEGIAEQVDPEKNKIHWDRPFSVTIDNKEYALRSIPGDIYHLVRDPRGFIFHRLNPAIVRPIIEFVTGRDQWGKKRDIAEQAKDYVTGFVPIPGQGFFTSQDRTIYDSILQSMGVPSWKYRTDAERIVREIQAEKSKAEAVGETKERFQLKRKLGEDFAKTGDLEPVKKAVIEGKITPKDISGIMAKAIKGNVERGVKGFNFQESLKVWKEANDEEKATIQPMLLQKWASWDATADERERYEKDFKEIMSWKPKGEVKRKRFSIREN